MARAKLQKVEEQDKPEIEDAGLAEFLEKTPHQAIALGECRLRKVKKVTDRGMMEEVDEVYVGDEGPVVYRSGWLFRLKCKACGKPKCTRIVVKLDEDKMLMYRDCKHIAGDEFTEFADIKARLED